MSLSRLVPERPDDLRRLPDVVPEVAEVFAFARPEPVWAPLAGERPRAAARLLAFVAATGVGAGVGLWILAEIVASMIRGLMP
jgi:hypothetical protein